MTVCMYFYLEVTLLSFEIFGVFEYDIVKP